MSPTSSALRSRVATARYLVAVLISALVAFNLELAIGLGDVRTASGAVLVGTILAIAVAFWPVFALCLANLARRQAPRALGGVLHLAGMAALMLTGLPDGAEPGLITGSAPAVLLALLAGWLVVETSQLAGVQRQFSLLVNAGAATGASTAA